MRKPKGFTLIELLVVIAIIGTLSSIVLVSLNRARVKARDTRRIADVKQIQVALEMYFDKIGHYPYNTDNDCSGWDVGNPGRGADSFIDPLVNEGFIYKVPIDPSDMYDTSCSYRYYRYGGCGSYYYVLGVRLERSQTEYGAPDEMDTCYEQTWWQSDNWYAVMRVE